jgi:hypothetical protein
VSHQKESAHHGKPLGVERKLERFLVDPYRPRSLHPKINPSQVAQKANWFEDMVNILCRRRAMVQQEYQKPVIIGNNHLKLKPNISMGFHKEKYGLQIRS